MAHLEGTAQSAGFLVISQSPDVCKSPDKPIPYNIVGSLDKSILVSTNVRFQKKWVFDTMSRVATVVGNEAGVGGGVASQTNLGMCKPIAGPSSTVYCNGNQICRHETAIYEMNLLGPNGTANTIGKVIYLGAMMSGPVGPKGSMPNGANGVIPAKSPKELSALDKIKNSLSIDSIEDAVSMSQKAYDLAQVDWGNPSAALGALGGMASSAGLGDLAAGIGAVNTAMNTDWDDPASVLAAAGALAGPVMKAGQAASDYLGTDELILPTSPLSESTPPFIEESQQEVSAEDIGLLPISETPLSTNAMADEVETNLMQSNLVEESDSVELLAPSHLTSDTAAKSSGSTSNESIDENGNAYSVCRPLGGDSKYLDHCFVVSNSSGPGSGEVHSFGMQNNGNLGPVDDTTKGFSEGTLQADKDAWNRAGNDPSVHYSQIPASSKQVQQAAENLQNDQDYAASGLGGANSNSAARAVADQAAGQPVELPGSRIKVGESSHDEINFEEPELGYRSGEGF